MSARKGHRPAPHVLGLVPGSSSGCTGGFDLVKCSISISCAVAFFSGSSIWMIIRSALNARSTSIGWEKNASNSLADAAEFASTVFPV